MGLPQGLAYNAPAAPQAMAKIAQALGGSSGPAAVFDLAKNNGAAVALRDLGMKPAGSDKACDISVKNQYPKSHLPLPPSPARLFYHHLGGGRVG